LHFNEQNGQKYFVALARGVRFQQYVGVLQVGNLTIEILPKTDRFKTDKKHWQAVLMDLLHECAFIHIDAATQAPLTLTTSPLLWIYVQFFVYKVEQLLQNGLQKNYQQTASNSNCWKGKVLFAKHLQYNWQHPERVYSRKQTYDFRHPIHQVLYKALQIVAQFRLPTSLQKHLKYLIKQFPVQEDINVATVDFKKLYGNPKYRTYHQALDLARMICLQQSPTLKVGKQRVASLLFDMNVLFEQYIFKQLKKQLPTDFVIRSQPSRPFWSEQRLRPDIWLQKGPHHFIIDTKWKILQHPSPSAEDLRQMYAYNHTFEATQSLLVYPNVLGLQNKAAPYTTPIHLQGEAKPHYCKVVFVDVLDEDGTLNKAIGAQVLEELA